MVWMLRSLFSHSPIDGHLVCFQFGAITKKAAVNIEYSCTSLDMDIYAVISLG